ncbi:MAG: DUF4345 family protein [Pseudomonadota bacterium]
MKFRLEKTQKVVLFIAGVLLIVVGVLVTTSPDEFYAANNIELNANVNLINELKAPAGMLLGAGLFMILGVFVRSFSNSAMWLATLIYLSYASSRFVSMASDGIPATGLVQAAALEAFVGLICLVILMIRLPAAGRSA